MRVTPIHWQLFLEVAEQFPALITSKFNGPQGKAQGKQLWETVSARLNGLGYGEKTIGEWRRALTDWKSKVKIKASKLRCSSTLTGGGSCDTPPLTDLEEKLLSLMGKKCLEGDDTKELGHCLSKTEKNKEHQIMGDRESNLDCEIISEPFTADDYYEESSFLEIPIEHNFDQRSHDVGLPIKDLGGKNILKRKWPDVYPSTSTSEVQDSTKGNFNVTKKTPNLSFKNSPITTPSCSLPLTVRNVNLLPKTSSPSSTPAQKRRKISSIPKIGKHLETMTSESVEIFKNIAQSTETIAKNSTRIANSFDELVLYLKNK